jgi:uncharacterized Zn finger protein
MAWYRDYFPPSRPIAVRGGIKARSKRGAFASQWWARRWLAVLEALNLGGRLERGRRYARQGQVVELDIQPGAVRAAVQGSRAKPYAIKIDVTRLSPASKQRLAAELAKNSYFLAKLMANEMPEDIEELFTEAQVSLFPKRASELKTDCSCPDWSNPCKHIAAVYYLLGEEFDRDPFLIFRLRGVEMESLLGPAPAAEEPAEEEPVAAAESFWEGSRPEVDLSDVVAPQKPAPLIRRLGSLPFWRGEEPLLDSLEPVYAAASKTAMEILLCSG